jgi:hypothetical protein
MGAIKVASHLQRVDGFVPIRVPEKQRALRLLEGPFLLASGVPVDFGAG